MEPGARLWGTVNDHAHSQINASSLIGTPLLKLYFTPLSSKRFPSNRRFV